MPMLWYTIASQVLLELKGIQKLDYESIGNEDRRIVTLPTKVEENEFAPDLGTGCQIYGH